MLIEQIHSRQHIIFGLPCWTTQAGSRFRFHTSRAQLGQRWFSRARCVFAWQGGCIDHFWLRSICEVIRGRLRQGHAFPFQFLFEQVPLLLELFLTDFQFSFKVGFSDSPAQSPILQVHICAPHGNDRLANKMHRPQSSHQDQRRQVNSA